MEQEFFCGNTSNFRLLDATTVIRSCLLPLRNEGYENGLVEDDSIVMEPKLLYAMTDIYDNYITRFFGFRNAKCK